MGETRKIAAILVVVNFGGVYHENLENPTPASQ